jgi:hypothetical protein
MVIPARQLDHRSHFHRPMCAERELEKFLQTDRREPERARSTGKCFLNLRNRHLHIVLADLSFDRAADGRRVGGSYHTQGTRGGNHDKSVRLPDNASPGNPPDWNASVDVDRAFEPLHHWFENALETDPARRFPDAVAALEAFNAATASRPTPKEVIEGLERFRGSIRSQRQLFGTYPAVEEIAATDIAEIWRSKQDDSPVKVKMWKRQAWADESREGPRILDFLNRCPCRKLNPASKRSRIG